jgi:diguanylate cyclase (GGDEF)-like protein
MARWLGRPSAPAVIVTLVVLAMSACVIGLVAWKAADARTTALAQRATAIQNLARSLAEQASHAIQSVDIALTDMVDLLRYQTPDPDRTDRHLRAIVKTLPQIAENVMVDAAGACKYSSRGPKPCMGDFAGQGYFAYHRDHADPDLHISGSPPADAAGRPTVNLSKRIAGADGRFTGLLRATVNSENFRELYATFQLGNGGGVSVLRPDGPVLIQSPTMPQTAQIWPRPFSGFHTIATGSGATTYVAYAQAPRYPFIIAVAQQEDDILLAWHAGLRSDLAVATLMMASLMLLAALLAWQFRIRLGIEKVLREREARLAELATTDGLTGLANRRTLDGFLRLEYAARPQISLLLLDIDNFKGFNDGFGHQAGDEALKRVAQVLAETTAASGGLAARYGGEEFAIILPAATPHGAAAIADLVGRGVRALEIVNPASERGTLTVSIGIASKTEATADEAALLRKADLALYEAKRRGRDCSVAWSALAGAAGIVPGVPPLDRETPATAVFTEHPARPA